MGAEAFEEISDENSSTMSPDELMKKFEEENWSISGRCKKAFLDAADKAIELYYTLSNAKTDGINQLRAATQDFYDAFFSDNEQQKERAWARCKVWLAYMSGAFALSLLAFAIWFFWPQIAAATTAGALKLLPFFQMIWRYACRLFGNLVDILKKYFEPELLANIGAKM